jgi:hypothetical protein
MANPAGPADRLTAGSSGHRRAPGSADRPVLTTRDIVPIGPNLLATVAGFLALMAAPWICLQVHLLLLEDAIGEDRIASIFALASPEETCIIAGVGSLLFLVIGMIVQAWQYHRPFASRWPVLLAFPIALGLLMPEAMVRGGSMLSGAIVGVVVAVAFGVQWVSLVVLREEMD